MSTSDQFSAVPFPVCQLASMLSVGKMVSRWASDSSLDNRQGPVWLEKFLPKAIGFFASFQSILKSTQWRDSNQIWTDEGQLKLQIAPPLASLAATQVITKTLWTFLYHIFISYHITVIVINISIIITRSYLRRMDGALWLVGAMVGFVSIHQSQVLKQRW